MRRELSGVDEDADYNAGVLGGGSADEGDVASVEGAHGGDEGNTARGEELRAAPCTQGGNGCVDLQRGCRGGKVRGGHG